MLLFTERYENNQIRNVEKVWACRTQDTGKKFMQKFLGKYGKKIFLGRPKHNLEDNIKNNLHEIE
jgi:hypothetical protein